jgi:hypothetical protein
MNLVAAGLVLVLGGVLLLVLGWAQTTAPDSKTPARNRYARYQDREREAGRRIGRKYTVPLGVATAATGLLLTCIGLIVD